MSPLPDPDTTPHHEVWLLDASGRMLEHDTLADKVMTSPFTPGRIGGLSLRMDAPLPSLEAPSPCRAVFHKRFSLPFPLPEMEIIPNGRGLIALRQRELAHYWMGSDPQGDEVCFNATELTFRESFLPLSQEGFAGLSFLHDRKLARLRSITGEPLNDGRFLPQKPHCLLLGDMQISLAESLEELKRMGRFSPGTEHIITLALIEDNHRHTQSFLIQREG